MTKVRIHWLFTLALVGCGPQHGQFSIDSLGDAKTIDQRSDGKFDVVCKDGRTEVDTQDQIQLNQVCQAPASNPPSCVVNNNRGQGVPYDAPTQELTFHGTATPRDGGAAQALTFTIRGSGLRDCWKYDRCTTWIEADSNLWGHWGGPTIEEDSFSQEALGTFISFNSIWSGDSLIPPADFMLRANRERTRFTTDQGGFFAPDGKIYKVDLATPSDVVPCAFVPNCRWQDKDNWYCGDAIDGDPWVLYRCEGGQLTSETVCTNGCNFFRGRGACL